MPPLNKLNLIWIDLEMTGLDVSKDRIIEIATIITDQHLHVIEEGPVLAIHQPESVLQGMDSWNIKHHGESGLIERVRNSTINETEAQATTLEFLIRYVPARESPMCGNSICQDRRFLFQWMPKLEAYFHYRHLDVSTLKILAQRWAPEVAQRYKKTSTHVALQDIYDSIEELRYYREHLFRR